MLPDRLLIARIGLLILVFIGGALFRPRSRNHCRETHWPAAAGILETDKRFKMEEDHVATSAASAG
jgi:hypothetical protein